MSDQPPGLFLASNPLDPRPIRYAAGLTLFFVLLGIYGISDAMQSATLHRFGIHARGYVLPRERMLGEVVSLQWPVEVITTSGRAIVSLTGFLSAGSHLPIVYDPRNVLSARLDTAAGLWLRPLMALSASFLGVLWSTGKLLELWCRRQEVSALLRDGRKIDGTIIEVCGLLPGMKTAPSGACYLRCEAFIDGERQEFVTDGLRMAPPSHVIGRKLRIYLAERGHSPYFIDVESAR